MEAARQAIMWSHVKGMKSKVGVRFVLRGISEETLTTVVMVVTGWATGTVSHRGENAPSEPDSPGCDDKVSAEKGDDGGNAEVVDHKKRDQSEHTERSDKSPDSKRQRREANPDSDEVETKESTQVTQEESANVVRIYVEHTSLLRIEQKGARKRLKRQAQR